MFNHLFFLLLLLLTVHFAPNGAITSEISQDQGFIKGVALYGLCLGMIVLQNKGLLRPSFYSFFLKLAQVELIATLMAFFFYFQGQNLWAGGGFSESIGLLFALSAYLLGLSLFHFTGSLRVSRKGRLEDVGRYLCFLAPFFVPMLFLSFLGDVLIASGTLSPFFLTLAVLSLAALALIGGPVFIRWAWRCRPFENLDLLSRLETLCARARFQHGGILEWRVMHPVLTAAIVGLLPRQRYVLFTQRLLEDFSSEEVEAVLAHEIGHHKHRHLWIFPFILLGMLVSAELLTPLLAAPFLKILPYPMQRKEAWEVFIFFLFYASIAGLYFRFIFGYFSRLFERQADLYVFNLNLDPHTMIHALDHLGTAGGNSHHVPSWHHYSLQQRIDFLGEAKNNQEKIAQHHKKVKRSLILYFILLGFVLGLLIGLD